MHAARRFLSVLATTVADTFHIIPYHYDTGAEVLRSGMRPDAAGGRGTGCPHPPQQHLRGVGRGGVYFHWRHPHAPGRSCRSHVARALAAAALQRVCNGCVPAVYRLCTGCVTCVSVLTGDSRMRHSTFWPPSRTCAASIYAASPTQATRTSTASRTRITGAYACIYVNHTHVCRCLYGCICLFDGRR